MKINRLGLILVFCLFTLPLSHTYAQSTNEQVKNQVNKGLQTYLKKLYPSKTCEHNGFSHFYTNKLKFTKNMTVNGTLRLWGKAGVTYRNARTGGNKSVEFYAEVVKVDGMVELSKLKWRSGSCMKFETLFERK
ncbi:MAG: hypothetical protein R8P61_16920 [Bacteroidia bacterium]|nr:hypothetical protein [Bacteroidia bacterium]